MFMLMFLHVQYFHISFLPVCVWHSIFRGKNEWVSGLLRQSVWLYSDWLWNQCYDCPITSVSFRWWMFTFSIEGDDQTWMVAIPETVEATASCRGPIAESWLCLRAANTRLNCSQQNSVIQCYLSKKEQTMPVEVMLFKCLLTVNC